MLLYFIWLFLTFLVLFVCFYSLRYSLIGFTSKINKIKGKSKEKVAILIPSYNEGELLFDAMNHFLKLSGNKKIVFLDDSDREWEWIKEKFEPERVYNFKNAEVLEKGDVVILHRNNREGFKGGALRLGHEFVKKLGIKYYAVFDIDWRPPLDWAEKAVWTIKKKKVACVQFPKISESGDKRKGLLTNYAFLIENDGRSAAKEFSIFGGTCGIFDLEKVEKAGGWKEGNLTEDLDLSIRLYLSGERMLHVNDFSMVSKGEEIPKKYKNYVLQQFRWAYGTIRCFLEYFPKIAKSDLPIKTKISMLYHFLFFLAHPIVFTFFIISIFFDLIYLNGSIAIKDMILISNVSSVTYFLVLFMPLLEIFKLLSMRKYIEVSLKDLVYGVLSSYGTIFSNTIASIFAFLGIKVQWFRTPKGRQSFFSLKNTITYSSLSLLVAFLIVLAAMFALEIFALGMTPNSYHLIFPIAFLISTIEFLR